MLWPRTARVLAIAVVAHALSACHYDCGTVRRTVANGTVRDAAGVALATAQVDLSESVGPSFLQLSVGVMGPASSAGAPLRGHVTRARLVTGAGELLAEIPTGTATVYVDAVVALPGTRLSETEYARVRSALLATRARVVLDTDLPGREHLEALLSDAHDAAGQVQRCTPT